MRRTSLSFLVVLALAFALLMPGMVLADTYDIMGNPSGAIGAPLYSTYGINVLNYFNGPIELQLFTNFPRSGDTCVSGSNSWYTFPADIFIKETYKGSTYEWAIPLVDHGIFNAGTMYAVGSFLTSDQCAPAGSDGAYLYNHGVAVLINSIGNNYGWTQFAPGVVTWTALADGLPNYEVDVFPGLPPGLFQDDPNGTWEITWEDKWDKTSKQRTLQ